MGWVASLVGIEGWRTEVRWRRSLGVMRERTQFLVRNVGARIQPRVLGTASLQLLVHGSML